MSSSDAAEGGTGVPAAPVISISRGQPSAAEVAAVVAALLAARAAAAGRPLPPARSSEWTSRSRLRPVLGRPGPHAWRSALWAR
jgi:hypothetical protein